MAVTEDVRTEVRAWLDDNWDPDLTVADWWQRLADSGWAMPSWPEEHSGRGLARPEANAVGVEVGEAGALGPPGGLGTMLAAPTIIAHGTDEQRQRFLPKIANGQEAWCQLFSEPGAGSDLAGLQCKAVKDGDEWVVNGQKVWTSGGQHADLGMLIARTDPDAPKHKGISYFGIPMHQPGIDVRPLVEMTGRALFNEVFLDDARVADDLLIGGLGNGWAVANTTLMNERASLGGGGGSSATSLALPGSVAGHLERRAGDFVAKGGRGGTATILAGRSNKLLQNLVAELGKDDDPLIRQDLMRLYSMDQISGWGVQRAKAGQASPALPNLAKLMMSHMTRLSRDLGLRIVGPAGTVMGPDTPGGGMIQELALFSPAPSIYGGTDEVQRNIIGERVLGLPKEPGPDKATPFSELPTG
ncbi:MAG TPA: acyl-CoA dehydrogenase family protein [Acidimicrobiales bacterium]|jgi:alkylation response protein AidB-like acyl-CoA dehydrogenase